MIISAENFLLIASILLFVSIIAGKTGYRFGVPALLLFLVVGMVFGSEGFGLQFSSFKQAQFVGMAALSVILFSGGMETKASDIKPVAAEGIILSTAGVLLTAVITGLFIYAMVGLFPKYLSLSFGGCMLLASVMSSTDSASVFSILRSKNLYLAQNMRPLLELESGSNDPMAYMLTIIFIQVVLSSSASIDVMLWTLVIQFVLGIVFGYLLGRLAVFVMNVINLNYSALYAILLLSFVFFIFSFTDLLGGNGYLAVYIAGLVVGNNKMIYKKSVITFFDGLTWLFQIIMFLILGLLVNPSELLFVWAPAVAIGIFMIIAARPISVFICLWPFKNMTRKAKWFVSWVGLRGAVPIIFATYPFVQGVPHSREIFNIVFFITIISLVVQGTTVPYSAKLLGLLSEPEFTKDFSVEVPEDIAVTAEFKVDGKFKENHNTVGDMGVGEGVMVMMIKRGGKFFIPNGNTGLEVGDKLLIIGSKEEDLQDYCGRAGMEKYEIYNS